MQESDYPARVTRVVARTILNVDDATFRKVLDANPQLKHRIPGEVRAKYLTRELFALLKPNSRCAALGEDKHT